MAFEGFPAGTFEFLAELTEHNNKPWFDANRERYEACYLAPALAFVEAIGPKLKALPGDVQHEARVSGSLFRVNRDIRFSKDKTPYKNHIDFWFWQGERKGWGSPGYFMRLEVDQVSIGCGIHHFDGPMLKVYRNAVMDDMTGTTLEAIVERLGPAGLYDIGARPRKSVPRGYDASHPRAGFLLYEGLVAMLITPILDVVHAPEFADYVYGHFEAMSPVNEWLASVFG